MINSNGEANKNYAALKNDLMTSGKVENMTRTSAPLTTIFGNTSGIRWAGAPPGENLVIGFLFAGEEFAKTVGTKIIEGRDFRSGDSNKVMFNKAAIETMGMKDPVGKKINWAGREREIIGIINNMVMNSPYDPADPLMVSYEDRWSNRLDVRLAKNTDIKAALAAIETSFKKHSPGYPFQYSFVDEEFQTKFNNEQLIGKLSVIFAGLAIFICCLGLFGLVASSIERRKKEIGIRKVLGASVQSLLVLMSKEFLILVAIAFLIAVPTAWYGMNKWLEDFSYRIDLGFGVFVAVALLTTVIALITVSLNASKAAVSNPVKTLRSE
jgi:ABC-type lipoprotein release transport system permease subunit